MTRKRLFVVLGALYFAQGLPFGFFTQALPVMLRARGVGLEQVGLTSLLALPWALKFLLAPLVDRVGTRRRWLVMLQSVMVVVLLLGGVLEPTHLRAVLMLCFVVNALAATQDIATDGLAVESLLAEDRGLANGLQVGAYRVGMVVGGGALLMLFDVVGWRGVFLCMALMMIASSLPLSRLDGRRPGIVARAATLSSFWRRSDARLILLVLGVFKFGEAFAVAMIRPRLVDLGLSLGELGWLVGTVGFAAGLGGALAGGVLVTRLGRRRALISFGLAQALAVLGYARLAGDHVWAVIAFEHFASGLATAALFTCIMDWSRAEAAGTDATIQASMVVVSTGLASALAGFSAARLGYEAHFLLAAALCAGAVAIVGLLFNRITQQETPCASRSTPAASAQ